MADKTTGDEVQDESQAVPDEQDDTEGHLIMPNIAAARALSTGRTQDGQRNARIRIRERDERPGEKRNR
jgi:hypothetical protein